MRLDNPACVREALLMYVLKNPQGLSTLAGKVKIGYRTLKRFIVNDREVTLPSLIKIVHFLEALPKVDEPQKND